MDQKPRGEAGSTRSDAFGEDVLEVIEALRERNLLPVEDEALLKLAEALYSNQAATKVVEVGLAVSADESGD